VTSTSRRHLALGGVALSASLQLSGAIAPPKALANKPLSSDWELVRILVVVVRLDEAFYLGF